VDAAWNDQSGARRDVGYALTLPSSPWLTGANQNFSILPQPTTIGAIVLAPPNMSQRVLVAGLVMSGSGQNLTDAVSRASYNYTRLSGLDNKVTGCTRAPHLVGPTMPRGDNLGMLDGSAQWRKFEVMVPRSAPSAAATVWW